MNVNSFRIVIFFLNPGTLKLLKKISPTKFVFFIGLRTLKPTRTRTLNRIPIWHGLILCTIIYIQQRVEMKGQHMTCCKYILFH